MQQPSDQISPEDVAYRRARRVWLSIGIGTSLLFHLLLAYLMVFAPAWKRPRFPQQVPVRLEFKQKESESAKKDKNKRPQKQEQTETRQIIEAPLIPTAKPEVPAHLGAQDHRTAREQKTLPKQGRPAAPATALQNGALRLQRAPEAEGRIEMPTKQKKSERYAALLPEKLEIVNEGHNDYIPNKNIPVGPVLDVNTTDFRFIGYFTAVRKLVDLAYYDVGPTLRDSPHVREKIEEAGKARFQGVSIVELKVMRSGLLVDTRLAKSSGDKDIDEFWTRILNLAAPYPPLPRDYPGDELVFTYALYYDFAYEGSKPSTRFMF